MPVYVAAGGPLVARYAGRSGDGFICTSGKGEELYRDKLLPAVDEGLAKSGRTRDDLDRMIEIKLSWDPDREQAVANCRFWARPVAHRRAEARHERPPRDGAPRRRAARRAGRLAVDRHRRPRGGRRRGAALRRPGASTTWSSTARATTSAGSSRTFADRVLPGLRELGAEPGWSPRG